MAKDPQPSPPVPPVPPVPIASIDIPPGVRQSREICAFNDAMRFLRKRYLAEFPKHKESIFVVTIAVRD